MSPEAEQIYMLYLCAFGDTGLSCWLAQGEKLKAQAPINHQLLAQIIGKQHRAEKKNALKQADLVALVENHTEKFQRAPRISRKILEAIEKELQPIHGGAFLDNEAASLMATIRHTLEMEGVY